MGLQICLDAPKGESGHWVLAFWALASGVWRKLCGLCQINLRCDKTDQERTPTRGRLSSRGRSKGKKR